MLVKDIKRDRLAYYCAKAQGWELLTEADNPSVYRPIWLRDNGFVAEVDYNPLTNGQQVYDLIVEFKITLMFDEKGDHWKRDKAIKWAACTLDECLVNGAVGYGSDPAEAVMRAVIASHYGEEIREEE